MTNEIFEAIDNKDYSVIENFLFNNQYSLNSKGQIGSKFVGKTVFSYLQNNASELLSKLMIEAAFKGNLELVKELLKNGVDINSKSDLFLEGPFVFCDNKTIYQATPFIAACANNHLEIAKFLVGQGADYNYVNKYGYNAAHVAAFNGYQNIVTKYLALELGFNMEQKTKDDFNVSQAVANGHKTRVKRGNGTYKNEIYNYNLGLTVTNYFEKKVNIPGYLHVLYAAISDLNYHVVKFLVKYRDVKPTDMDYGFYSYHSPKYLDKTPIEHAKSFRPKLNEKEQGKLDKIITYLEKRVEKDKKSGNSKGM